MDFKKTGEFLRNNLLTIMALTVSAFTLIMYVRQTNILTKQTDMLIEQNKATTWPYLYIGRGVSMDRVSMGRDSIYAYNINLINQGNGPAIIEKVVVRLDGTEMETWLDVYEQMQIPKDIVINQKNSSIRGRVVMPGETFTVIEWSTNALLAHIYPKFYNLELEICYRSVLNEYWTVKRSSFDEKRYYEDGIMTHNDGCLSNASKYFKE